MERMAHIVPALGGVLLLAISSLASAQDSSLPPGYTPNWVATPMPLRAASPLRAELQAATTAPQPKTYPDTSLTACPKGEKLLHFFYYLDKPEFQGSTWCAAPQADLTWANANDPLRWRIPYTLDYCNAGVSWGYSHSFEDGSRYHSSPQRDVGMVCMPDECPIAELPPLTDPDALQYVSGKYRKRPNLEQVDPAVVRGGQCIIDAARAQGYQYADFSSGYRPQSYQDWMRAVFDKVKEFEGDSGESCKERKQAVLAISDRLKLRYRPADVSPHTSGKAVDLSGIPSALADGLAAQCGMYRRVAGDPVHYELRGGTR